jgi:hypothetical protein
LLELGRQLVFDQVRGELPDLLAFCDGAVVLVVVVHRRPLGDRVLDQLRLGLHRVFLPGIPPCLPAIVLVVAAVAAHAALSGSIAGGPV